MSPYKTIKDEVHSSMTLTLTQIQADMRDVAFYFHKKTGLPKFKDSGLADVFLGGKGITIKSAYRLRSTNVLTIPVNVTLQSRSPASPRIRNMKAHQTPSSDSRVLSSRLTHSSLASVIRNMTYSTRRCTRLRPLSSRSRFARPSRTVSAVHLKWLTPKLVRSFLR
jgi:Family of unknown function (DUF5923)